MFSGQSAVPTAFTQPHLVLGLLDTPQLYLAILLVKIVLKRTTDKIYLDKFGGLNKYRSLFCFLNNSYLEKL